MPNDPNPTPNEPTLDELIAAFREADGREYEVKLSKGRILREIQSRDLASERGLTFERLCEQEFSVSRSRGYHLIKVADQHDQLVAAGVEPLGTVSHVEQVYSLVGSELLIDIVARAREAAHEEGSRLCARHLEAAREAILQEQFEQNQAEAEAVAALRRLPDGLILAVDDEVMGDLGVNTPTPEVLDRRGTTALIPFEEAIYQDARRVDPERPGGTQPPDDETEDRLARRPIGRTDLDPVADLAWAVVAPGPRATARTWEPSDGPFRGVYFPGRLAMTSVPYRPTGPGRDGRPDGRAKTVIVAPGIDLFEDDVPQPVACDIADAIGRDPARRYLVRTRHPERASEIEWPGNAVVCVEARDAASARQVARVVGEIDARNMILDVDAVTWALILVGVIEPVAAESLAPFAMVMLRGAGTTQAAFDSVVDAVPIGRIHVGDEVTARLRGYAPLPELPVPPTDRLSQHTSQPHAAAQPVLCFPQPRHRLRNDPWTL